MFEQMEISESIHEVVVQPSYKTLPGKTPTVLVTADKIEEKPPCRRLSPRWMIDLASSENNV